LHEVLPSSEKIRGADSKKNGELKEKIASLSPLQIIPFRGKKAKGSGDFHNLKTESY
jgi:hypothetical protein